MTKKQKKQLYRIIAAAALLAAGLLIGMGLPASSRTAASWRWAASTALYLAAYIAVGGSVLLKAASNIRRGHIFDENFLMAIATAGAICLGEYREGVAVMLFYQVGALFESVAVGRSRRSIADLMDIRPDHANIMVDGLWIEADPEEVPVGAEILVKPGERVPLDGTVSGGQSSLDVSSLTGEPKPRAVSAGSLVYSGCVNLDGAITVRVDKAYGQSTAARILDLVENAGAKKASMESFITRFARYYTPAVVACAACLAVLPPLLLPGAVFGDWVYRALTFLVISCPCALVISIPLSFFGGLGGASGRGVLVKGGNYLEALARAEIVVFDKTGTLTKGSFDVSEIAPIGLSEPELLELAALAECYSAHPIARSLREAHGKAPDTARVGEVRERAGFGVEAAIDGEAVYVGSKAFIEEKSGVAPGADMPDAAVHLARGNRYLGYIVVADQIKESAGAAIAGLKALGIKKTVMLTGDSGEAGGRVAARLGVDEVYAGLLPADKVDKVEGLMKEKSAKGKLVFVGDGVNDAPALARSDVGVAMGALGSEAAVEAADVVIMDDDPLRLVAAVKGAAGTVAIARQNTAFALGVKGLILLLGALGFAGMWAAVFADVGVAVLAVANAMRALR
ncbi:MAG: cadmium-translocating P-type ATPase [Clostridiales bacterium]|nr:cadmium-translocating P-type ATPase [Clostridiales bacterium]